MKSEGRDDKVDSTTRGKNTERTSFVPQLSSLRAWRLTGGSSAGQLILNVLLNFVHPFVSTQLLHSSWPVLNADVGLWSYMWRLKKIRGTNYRAVTLCPSGAGVFCSIVLQGRRSDISSRSVCKKGETQLVAFDLSSGQGHHARQCRCRQKDNTKQALSHHINIASNQLTDWHVSTAVHRPVNKSDSSASQKQIQLLGSWWICISKPQLFKGILQPFWEIHVSCQELNEKTDTSVKHEPNALDRARLCLKLF